jgi:tetratricopeptide (TPR) repeat protein
MLQSSCHGSNPVNVPLVLSAKRAALTGSCYARVQAYYRRADAKLALGKFGQALKDFKLAAKVAPRDPDLKRKLAECEKESQRQRFEKAVRSGAPWPLAPLTRCGLHASSGRVSCCLLIHLWFSARAQDCIGRPGTAARADSLCSEHAERRGPCVACRRRRGVCQRHHRRRGHPHRRQL